MTRNNDSQKIFTKDRSNFVVNVVSADGPAQWNGSKRCLFSTINIPWNSWHPIITEVTNQFPCYFFTVTVYLKILHNNPLRRILLACVPSQTVSNYWLMLLAELLFSIHIQSTKTVSQKVWLPDKNRVDKNQLCHTEVLVPGIIIESIVAGGWMIMSSALHWKLIHCFGKCQFSGLRYSDLIC